jgi:hypothetical protein
MNLTPAGMTAPGFAATWPLSLFGLRQPTYLLEYSSFRSIIGFSSTVQI